MTTSSHLLSISTQELLGDTEIHVTPLLCDPQIKVHIDVVEPLNELIAAAGAEGFDLRIASGFRSFERQSLIWNQKCSGQRKVLDAEGLPVDMVDVNAWQRIQCILRWSALPGTSRHHWGTDVDIFDAAAVDDDYRLQLHPDEYVVDGVFGRMTAWLQDYLRMDHSPGFFWPYQHDCGGVMPEPWHISYQPVAIHYQKLFSVDLLCDYLEQLPMERQLKEQSVVIEHVDEIYERFIRLCA